MPEEDDAVQTETEIDLDGVGAERQRRAGRRQSILAVADGVAPGVSDHKEGILIPRRRHFHFRTVQLGRDELKKKKEKEE